MRRALAVLLCVTLVAGCTVRSGTPTVRPAPTQRATPRPTALVAPTPTRSPTPKPKPTLRPARLTWSRITYPPNVCWDSTFRDSEGHETGGLRIKLEVTVRNRGDRISDPVWLTIESTGIFGMGTNPEWTAWSPGKPTVWSLNDNGLLFRGPAIKGNDTIHLRFTVVFDTSLDVRYDVHVMTATSKDQMMALRSDGVFLQAWSLWSKSKFCY